MEAKIALPTNVIALEEGSTKSRMSPRDRALCFDQNRQVTAPVGQLLTDCHMIDVSQLAPIREAVVIAGDPFDRFLFQESVILSRRLFNRRQIQNRFVPCLPQYGNRQVPLRSRL